MCKEQLYAIKESAEQSLRAVRPTVAIMEIAFDALETELRCAKRHPDCAIACTTYIETTLMPLLDQVWENVVIIRRELEGAMGEGL